MYKCSPLSASCYICYAYTVFFLIEGVDQIQSLGSSSGTLTLETLFRNASMQQSQKVRSQTSVVETSKPPPAFHR